MVLAVAGMLAGILLRVRSFLFLGLMFLVLDFLSMIWHAADDCTRPGSGTSAASPWARRSWPCSPCSRAAERHPPGGGAAQGMEVVGSG